jgi:hypothetical protein
MAKTTVRTLRKKTAGSDASRKPPDAGGPVSFATVCELALALPGMEEGTAYGTPALRVRGKFLARLREDGETLALRIGFDERDILLASDPAVFFLTDHYRGYPAVLVRLAAVVREQLREILEVAWSQVAPKRLVAERQGALTRSAG